MFFSPAASLGAMASGTSHVESRTEALSDDRPLARTVKKATGPEASAAAMPRCLAVCTYSDTSARSRPCTSTRPSMLSPRGTRPPPLGTGPGAGSPKEAVTRPPGACVAPFSRSCAASGSAVKTTATGGRSDAACGLCPKRQYGPKGQKPSVYFAQISSRPVCLKLHAGSSHSTPYLHSGILSRIISCRYSHFSSFRQRPLRKKRQTIWRLGREGIAWGMPIPGPGPPPPPPPYRWDV
mmetsp:Transcript_17477/g.66110  ORF Transcript_17477/g.66110 Transcript_17477/m.66110 type:complete len:238 (-) Transcript_17477:203-916(-)